MKIEKNPYKTCNSLSVHCHPLPLPLFSPVFLSISLGHSHHTLASITPMKLLLSRSPTIPPQQVQKTLNCLLPSRLGRFPHTTPPCNSHWTDFLTVCPPLLYPALNSKLWNPKDWATEYPLCAKFTFPPSNLIWFHSHPKAISSNPIQSYIPFADEFKIYSFSPEPSLNSTHKSHSKT